MTLPQAELHVHLEGTATPALVRRLAARHGVEVPPGTIEGDRFVWRDFLDFLDTYDRAAAVGPDGGGLPRRHAAYLADVRGPGRGLRRADRLARPRRRRRPALRRDGRGHRRRASTTRARRRASRAGSSITAVRNLGRGAAEAIAAARRPPRTTLRDRLRPRRRRGRLPARAVRRAFDIAHEAGLGIAVHAGEWAGPASVRAALDLPVPGDPARPRRPGRRGPGARRRAGGARDRARGVPDLQRRPRRLPELRGAPFPVLRAAGVSVTLGSDDPPYWDAPSAGSTTSRRRPGGSTTAALLGVTRTALEGAFVPDDLRAALLARIPGPNPAGSSISLIGTGRGVNQEGWRNERKTCAMAGRRRPGVVRGGGGLRRRRGVERRRRRVRRGRGGGGEAEGRHRHGHRRPERPRLQPARLQGPPARGEGPGRGDPRHHVGQ